MKLSKLFLLLALAAPTLAAAAPASWHHPLSLAQGGYWPLRVAVTIENPANVAIAGDPVTVAVPALSGTPVAAVRACNAAGQELLFDVVDADGAPKRAGKLSATDRVVLPVECPAQGTATLYVYGGNESALLPADFLRTGLQNGGFEAGGTHPLGWVAGDTDSQHTVSYQHEGGRGGGRCVRTEVAAGAPSSWVKYLQSGIQIVGGRKYRLTAWVRGENVVGTAGWYLHVDGAKPQMINQVLNAGSGTYAWKQIELTFTAPESAVTATVGTVLHGTGRAWFDDVALTALDTTAGPRVTVGAAERLQLATAPAANPSLSREWPYAVTIRVLNLTDKPAQGALVHADTRAVRRYLRQLPADGAVRVVDPTTGKEVANCVRLNDAVMFTASLPPQSAREYVAYFSTTRRQPQGAFLAAYERLCASPANLAPNGSFEAGTALPEGWACTGEAGSKAFSARLGTDARFGKRSAEFTVAPDAKTDWVGWRSGEIPVQPGATYFYSGFLRAEKVDGSAMLHGHIHDATGKLTASSPHLSTRPSVSGDSEWEQSSALVRMPGDAASFQIHLTTNTRGTLRHDGILFCQALTGEGVRVASAATPGAATGLRVWEVNPLVKVFPDDVPGAQVRGVALECARNEYEPFQLVLRSDKALKGARVSVSVLRSATGAVLPPVRVERIGFVPIDHPSGYYQSGLPEWYRKMPTGAGSTDGWAGTWPDPLIPDGPFDLTAGAAQPLWFTVRAPQDAAPGEYRGQVAIQVPGEKQVVVPVRVRVLPFTLPERTHLRAIFDLRTGPGGDFGSGLGSKAGRQKWLRFLAERRVTADSLSPMPTFTYKDGKVSMDTTAFDEAARFYFDTVGMNHSYTPNLFYAFGWAHPPKRIFGLEPFTPEYNSAYKQMYRLFSEHVKKNGWHDRFTYYISDEPHFKVPEVVEQMKKVCDLAHEADPKMPIYSSTWRHCPEWDESLDIWGVGQYGCFPVAEMERLRKAGKQIWITCDGQMATDTPYLATERLLPYYCYKYGAGAFEFWGVSWWTYNPWERGWHTYISQSDDGKKRYWIRYPNGDGYLAYPGRNVGVDGPVSSIRLEQVREGLEDHEAILILEDLMAKARKAGRPTGEAERALKLARDLVTIPNAGGLRSTEILSNPDAVPQVRKAVNAAIVKLAR